MGERAHHDEFVEAILEQPGTAGALLRERMPEAVVRMLAPGEPELVKGSFIDGRLRHARSGRLCRMRLAAGGDLCVYCLVEHRSAPDPRIGWQLLRYMVRTWERLDREAKGRGRLPPIVPRVVYHGGELWGAPRRFSGMVEAGPELAPHLLDFPFEFLDVPHVPEAEVPANPVLRAGLLVLKDSKVRTGGPR